MADPWAGHRHWWDPDFTEDPALVNVWTPWDYALLSAYQIIEDMQGANNQPIWIDQDPEVQWEIGYVRSYSDAELARNKEQIEKMETEYPGIMPYLIPHTEHMAEQPSLERWGRLVEEDQGTYGEKIPEGAGRPPTPEELAKLAGSTPDGKME